MIELPTERSVPRNARRSWLGAIALALSFGTATGCIYDPDDPCSEGMEVYGDNLRCVCPAGSVYTPTGCVACGENEVATASGCQCLDGYSRPGDGAACVETPTELGTPCEPAAAACPAAFPHCEPSADGGYCTTTCSSNDDCSGGYACNADAICEKPPAGLGKSCASPDDCAGTEATFCDTFVTQTCLVQGCTVAPDDCFMGYECCDLSAFGLPQPLCVAQGACMP